MSSSGIAAVTPQQRYRYLQWGGEVPTELVLLADSASAQQGGALHVSVQSNDKILGLPHYNWAPLYSASWPSFSPWDPVQEESDTPWYWPQSNEGFRTQAAMRCEMRVGSSSKFWWADLRQGVYAVPPCDEFRVSMWVRDWVGIETPIPDNLSAVSVQAALGAAPQGWRPDPYTCTCEVGFTQPSGSAVTWTGSLKALPPYTRRWRSQVVAWSPSPFDGLYLQTQTNSAHVMGNDSRPGEWQEPVDGPVRAAWSVPDHTDEIDVLLRIVAEVGP